MKKYFLFSYSIILSIFVLFSVSSSVYGDGLFEENLPPATVGDREASLYTKINPPILTSESKENAFFELRLFDAKTDETIEHTSYFVAVEKDGNLIMRDLFHSHTGELRLKITPQDIDGVNIFGSTEPFLGGWVSQTGDISVTGPLLLEGGLYHFAIEIFGIDHDRNIFTPDDAPRFDSWLSVGDIYHDNISFNNNDYNVTLISYYDQVQNFDFNSDIKSISWEMPFNWDLDRIQDQNIFVHEEIKIPKSFEAFGTTTSFDAQVNGIPVSGRTIAVDPFTEDKNLIIHYLLNKGDIIKLAEVINNQTSNDQILDLMVFELSPSEQTQIITSSETVTDTGGISIEFKWTPDIILPNEDTILNLNFGDAFDDQNINGDMKYDLIFYDQNGAEILKKQDLTAINATDTQILKFPSKGIFQMEVHIKSITYPDVLSPDETRNGIGRGNVVVS